jgi:hypothetical protein
MVHFFSVNLLIAAENPILPVFSFFSVPLCLTQKQNPRPSNRRSGALSFTSLSDLKRTSYIENSEHHFVKYTALVDNQ